MSDFKPVGLAALDGCKVRSESLCEKGDVLEIVLLDETDRKILIRFDDYLVYRKMDEGDALKTLAESASSGCGVFEVFGSEFLDWFIRESLYVRDKQGLKHFTLFTVDSVFDVIGFGAPKVA